MNSIYFDHTITQNFKEAIQKEWLETNGLGGWASSTISGAHNRRYHGLLVAAMHPPAGRVVLLSRLDETIYLNGQTFGLELQPFVTAGDYPSLIHANSNIHPKSVPA